MPILEPYIHMILPQKSSLLK
uniref:Uncharacterized protein n=1 Tax=Arundo donax TaxID=35708 RepID=A0A0A9EBK7_ARUDO